ncbi:MAG: MarR family transcriptional regulator [Chloroflexi bacterium]|nr:MarR family transcriptional regulator [Chloroflexota bacterium]
MTTWVRLRQAAEAAMRAMEIELGKRQTTLAQTDVLLILSMSRVPMSPGEISSYVFREKHSVSALLSRMQRAGYVRKVRSKKDQRVVKIQIQPKGKELLDRALPVILGYARDILVARFSDKEIKQFDKYLKGLRDVALQELGTEARSVPPTIEWKTELVGHWKSVLKDYHTGPSKAGPATVAAKSK